ncbi:hypothetical protein Dolphis_109 [Pseudomonas phage Dolphis]|nr:hypothetical protein Dolphis_109 [Pseudomonas phage Dolphis]
MSLNWRRRVVAEFEASSMRELVTWLRDQGHSLARSAEMLSISWRTMKAEADRLGVEFERNKKPQRETRPKGSPDQARLLPYQGEMLSMHEVSRRTGIGRTTIKYRLDVLGWTPEQALSKPVGEGSYGSRKRDAKGKFTARRRSPAATAHHQHPHHQRHDAQAAEGRRHALVEGA